MSASLPRHGSGPIEPIYRPQNRSTFGLKLLGVVSAAAAPGSSTA